MDRSPKQNISKETQALHDALDEMDLTEIFRTFHSNAEEYTFFSSEHGTFCRMDHNLGHKSNLSFSDHNAVKLDISITRKNCKKHKQMEINQHISK